MEREIKFAAAWDKRNDDPDKNYGIHGVTLTFYLKGSKGVVQFVVYTNWHLKYVQDELDSEPVHKEFPHLTCRPLPADLGYHSSKPMYEGQKPMDKDCSILDRVFNILLEQGDEGVWKELEAAYERTFGEDPDAK